MATTKKTVAKKAATKKATTKKVTTKKATTKRATARKAAPAKKVAADAKRPLVQASDHQSFWTTDGQILNDLIALHQALKAMDAAVYRYHVTKDRHDFADWVAAVLQDDMCATALRKAKTPKTAHTVIVKHLKYYHI